MARNPLRIWSLGQVSIRLVATFLLFSGSAWATTELTGVRLKDTTDRTRLVLDLSDTPRYELFALDSPPRVVVDLADARVRKKPSVQGSAVKGIRTGIRAHGVRRVVIDLHRPRKVEHFPLAPSGTRGYRIVVDLLPSEAKNTAVKLVEPPPALASSKLQSGEPSMGGDAMQARPWVIVVDPGHGGKDSGAVGRRGNLEKTIVLQVARRLRDAINREPGMRAVMTRDSDRFLHLRQRIEVARRNQADLFVSIHADSFHNRAARGSSVYVLSRRGASSEAARWLARRENAADLVGGATLKGVDKDVQQVVLNMLQDHTISDSWSLADHVLKALRQVGPVHKVNVERAEFVVLKSPDIPSILVETAFLSNAHEEAKLREASHQQALAMAILQGIRAYVASRGPRLEGARVHLVQRGETLGAIARRYQVSLSALRHVNHIQGDLLKVGAALTIPRGI